MRSNIFLTTLKESGIKEIFVSGSKKDPMQRRNTKKDDLSRLRERVIRCTKCTELVSNRHSVVFGSGNSKAKLVFVGEAPGGEEDRQGLPFVGPAGQLLTKMIQAIGLSREEVFIVNVLKCRPPGNRSPKPLEIQNCEPYLVEQLALIHPKLICALGTFASQTLLKTEVSISNLRGKIWNYEGIPVICTFHPAYLLRSPSEKKKSWEDLKALKALLDQKNSS